MRSLFKVSGFALAGALLVGTASAQFDTNGPNAVMTVQGQVVSLVDPVNHDIGVALPGFLNIEITTGVNAVAPILLLGSTQQPAPGAGFPAVPWGGSIDIGTFMGGLPTNVFIIGNGLAPAVPTDAFFSSNNGIPAAGVPPTFALSYSVATPLNGATMAIQGIVSDPTNPLFPLDNTEAADLNFATGLDVVAITGDDGTVQVPFSAGMTFPFHGQVYTSVFINGNGFVTFGAAPNGYSTYGRDVLAWAPNAPSIAALKADWYTPNSPLGGVHFLQIGNQVTISWESCPHLGSNDSNDFSITLQLDDGANPNAGNFGVVWTNLDLTATNDLGCGIAGHTPGGAATNVVDTDLNAVQSFGAGAAMFEEHDGDGFAFSFAGYDGLGTPRSYTNFTLNKSGRSVNFVPSGFTLVPGDLGYTSLPTGVQPNDANGFVGSNAFSDAGGEFGYLAGAFEGFTIGSPMASIVFDPGGLSIPAVPTYRYGDPGAPANPTPPAAGQFRQYQGIEFLTQPMIGLGGTVTVRVTFDDGTFADFQTVVSAPGIFATVISGLGDDTIHGHTLLAPVTWYGVAQTQLTVSSNGPIMFGSVGNPGWTDTDATLANGFNVNAPGATAFWGDLNGLFNGSTWVITEDTVNGTVQLTYTAMAEFSSGNPLGSFSVTFGALGANSVFFDYTGYTGGTTAQSWSLGVSDGSAGVGSTTLLSNGTSTGIASVLGTYQSTTAGATLPDSIAEQFPAGTGDPSLIFPAGINWIDAASGGGDWLIF